MTTTDLLVPEDLLDRWLEGQGSSWAQLEAGDLGYSMDEVQLYLVRRDPVLWVERSLVERDDGGKSCWRLFDYQKPSMRLRCNVVHKDGSEVGKTREIVGLVSWLAAVYSQSSLVAGALDGNLEDIWDELHFQAAHGVGLGDAIDWDRTKTKPYRKMVFKNGAVIHFRPAGSDGKAFRGIHVDYLFFDEAAVPEGEKVWSEFWRARKPRGGESRIYSVPNGNRETGYYRLCSSATPLDDHLLVHPDSIDPMETPMPGSPEARGVEELDGSLEVRDDRLVGAEKLRYRLGGLEYEPSCGDRLLLNEAVEVTVASVTGAGEVILAEPSERPIQAEKVERIIGKAQPLVLVHWPKTLMPAPFWTPEREAEKVVEYGGRETAGYRQNVLGEDGDPGGVVFPHEKLVAACEHGREYVHLELRVGDDGRLFRSAWKLAARWENRGRRPMVVDEETGAFPSDADALRALMGECLVPLGGRLVGGIDVGWSDDPTEIVIDRIGQATEWLLRITLLGWDSAAWQRVLLQALDEMLRPVLGWGLDAGGRGQDLEHSLLNETDGQFRGRLSGFHWHDSTESRDPESGKILRDTQAGKPRRESMKELATRLLEHRLDRGTLRWPADLGIVNEWSSHTQRPTRRGRSFAQENDHTIDAQRAAVLRAFLREHPGGDPPPATHHHKVPGARREQLRQLDRF